MALMRLSTDVPDEPINSTESPTPCPHSEQNRASCASEEPHVAQADIQLTIDANRWQAPSAATSNAGRIRPGYSAQN